MGRGHRAGTVHRQQPGRSGGMRPGRRRGRLGDTASIARSAGSASTAAASAGRRLSWSSEPSIRCAAVAAVAGTSVQVSSCS